MIGSFLILIIIQIKQFVLLVNDFTALSYYFGYLLTLFLAGQSIAIFTLACVLRKQLIIWLSCLALLASYSLPGFIEYFVSFIAFLFKNKAK